MFFLIFLLFKIESTLCILDILFVNYSSHDVNTRFTLTPSIMHSVGPSDFPTISYFTVEYMELHFLTTSFYLFIYCLAKPCSIWAPSHPTRDPKAGGPGLILPWGYRVLATAPPRKSPKLHDFKVRQLKIDLKQRDGFWAKKWSSRVLITPTFNHSPSIFTLITKCKRSQVNTHVCHLEENSLQHVRTS